MRGEDTRQSELFSYGSLEERIPAKHPLRSIRTMVDEALGEMSTRLDEIYPEEGRRSIYTSLRSFWIPSTLTSTPSGCDFE